jgi:hypothetical protein
VPTAAEARPQAPPRGVGSGPALADRLAAPWHAPEPQQTAARSITGAELLQLYGGDPLSVYSKGNCQFDALGRTRDPTVNDPQLVRAAGDVLREQIVAELQADRERRLEQQRYGVTPDRVKALLRGPNPSDEDTWGDDDTLHAAANVLGETIVVIRAAHHGGRHDAFASSPVEWCEREFKPEVGADGAPVRHLLLVVTVRPQQPLC